MRNSSSTSKLFITTVHELIVILARLHIMGATLPVFTRFDNPAAVAESPTKQLTQHYLVTINWWLLLAPGKFKPRQVPASLEKQQVG